MKNLLKQLAKSVLIPYGLTAAGPATDAAIHTKMFGSDNTTLMTSNEEMNEIMKIVISPEDSGLLIKGVSKTIKIKANQQKGGYLWMLLCTLDANFLGSLLTVKDTIREVEGTVRESQDFWY